MAFSIDRPQALPALSLAFHDGFTELVARAESGGAFPLVITNNGLAPARTVFADATLVLYPLDFVTGRSTFAWEPESGSHRGHWRRMARGELFGPAQIFGIGGRQPGGRIVVEEGAPRPTAEDLCRSPGDASVFVQTDKLWGAAVGRVEPGESRAVTVKLDGGRFKDGLGSGDMHAWCVLFRCFDLVGDPRPDLRVPTPAAPAHATKLVCLHDASMQ